MCLLQSSINIHSSPAHIPHAPLDRPFHHILRHQIHYLPAPSRLQQPGHLCPHCSHQALCHPPTHLLAPFLYMCHKTPCFSKGYVSVQFLLCCLLGASLLYVQWARFCDVVVAYVISLLSFSTSSLIRVHSNRAWCSSSRTSSRR